MSIKNKVYMSTAIKSKTVIELALSLEWCFGLHCLGQGCERLAFDFDVAHPAPRVVTHQWRRSYSRGGAGAFHLAASQ